MRILVVEDSVRLQKSLCFGLRKAGYAVDVTGDGEEGLWLAESNDYDAIVLDLMLPGLDGLTVLERLRAAGKDTRILILTAKDTVEDRVHGLQMGADDYLTKPFAFEEFLARVESLVRRRHGRTASSIRIGDLEMDAGARTVERAGCRIELTPREYRVLEYLVHNQGKVVSRTELEEHVYDAEADLFSNVVDSTVCSLRKKLQLSGCGPLIHTRRGMGYVLEAPKA